MLVVRGRSSIALAPRRCGVEHASELFIAGHQRLHRHAEVLFQFPSPFANHHGADLGPSRLRLGYEFKCLPDALYQLTCEQAGATAHPLRRHLFQSSIRYRLRKPTSSGGGVEHERAGAQEGPGSQSVLSFRRAQHWSSTFCRRPSRFLTATDQAIVGCQHHSLPRKTLFKSPNAYFRFPTRKNSNTSQLPCCWV